MLEQVAEALGLDARSSTSMPCACARGGALARARCALDQLETCEPIEQRRAVEHDVEVLDALGAPARGAREDHAADGSSARSASQSASPTASARSSNNRWDGRSAAPASSRREHGLLELRAEATQRAQAVCRSGLAQRLRRVDPQLVKSRRARFGPRPGRPVIASRPGGKRSRSLTAAGISPSRSARGSSPRASRRCRPAPSRAPRARVRPPRSARRGHLRGVAVGEHAVDHRPVELVEVCELVQSVRDHAVGGFVIPLG